MKTYILLIAMALFAIRMSAQVEVMKVETKDGKITEFKVDDVAKVSFDTKTTSDDDITTIYLIMWVGDKKNIEGTVVSAISENDFVASVNGNQVTANHAGATVIMVNEKHPVAILVYSNYTTIPDPVLRWGEPKDTIKAHHTKGTIDKDEANALSYKNCDDAELIGYTFDDNGGLNGAVITVSSSKSMTLYNYLKERYYIYPEKQSDGGYLGVDGYDAEHIKTMIVYYPASNACYFLPYSSLSGSPGMNSSKASQLFETFDFDDKLDK